MDTYFSDQAYFDIQEEMKEAFLKISYEMDDTTIFLPDPLTLQEINALLQKICNQWIEFTWKEWLELFNKETFALEAEIRPGEKGDSDKSHSWDQL